MLVMLITSCSQSEITNDSNEAASVSAVAQEKKTEFRHQSFLFMDDFNRQMREMGNPTAIVGAEVQEEEIGQKTSLLSVISPTLQVNWLPNDDGSDFQSLIISHQYRQAEIPEYDAVNILLITGIGFSVAEKEKFYAKLLEHQQRLVKMNELKSRADADSTLTFLFGGYLFTVRLDGKHIIYNREKQRV